MLSEWQLCRPAQSSAAENTLLHVPRGSSSGRGPSAYVKDRPTCLSTSTPHKVASYLWDLNCASSKSQNTAVQARVSERSSGAFGGDTPWDNKTLTKTTGRCGRKRSACQTLTQNCYLLCHKLGNEYKRTDCTMHPESWPSD